MTQASNAVEARDLASEATSPVVSWLLTEGRRYVDPGEFLEAFALRLRQSGVDVARITTGVPILHPQLFSYSCLWRLGKGSSERRYHAELKSSLEPRERSDQDRLRWGRAVPLQGGRPSHRERISDSL